jgi:hypothetical protein
VRCIIRRFITKWKYEPEVLKNKNWFNVFQLSNEKVSIRLADKKDDYSHSVLSYGLVGANILIADGIWTGNSDLPAMEYDVYTSEKKNVPASKNPQGIRIVLSK